MENHNGKVEKKYKISFCTVCMNRLHHLKKTLPKNIKDNLSYGKIEFVLINYNSQDGMDSWVNKEMLPYIEKGILKYYKTSEPNYFRMSHSKNVAAKMATGDIICNIDADNYAGPGFAKYLNSIFTNNKQIYVIADSKIAPSDCFGKISVLRSDFYKLRGYDEKMIGYGGEDSDFCHRLKQLNKNPHFIKDSIFLNAISHSGTLRVENSINSIYKIYLNYIDYANTEILCLYNNKTFKKGRIIFNPWINASSIENLFKNEKIKKDPYGVFNNTFNTGNWKKLEKDNILLEFNNDTKVIKYKIEGSLIKSKGIIFHQVLGKENIADKALLVELLNNLLTALINKKESKIVVNENGFGEIVFEPTNITIPLK